MQLSDLRNWIIAQQSEVEATLRQLVNINTYTANIAGVDEGMDVLSNLALSMNFNVEVINDRHRLIKAINGKSKPRILLISHMDTVFPVDSGFLEYQELANGFVRGPGVGDIKGGLIMGLWAMLAISLLCEDYDVQMIVSADEETGSPTIRDWYVNGHIGADVAIGLEPGFPQGELSADVDLGVVYQRRGYGAIRFKVAGKASHSGTPHLGLSAIEAVAQRIVRLHQLNEWDRGISVNVGIMAGGISPNTVAGEAEATVSFRYERMADGDATKTNIESILKDSYVKNDEFDVADSLTEMETLAFIPPMEKTTENMQVVEIVLEEAQRLGQSVVPIARGGGSDANFTSRAGTPSICGMGAPAEGIHTTGETIHLPMLFKRIELLASTLYRLTNG